MTPMEQSERKTGLIADLREHADYGENNPYQPMPWTAVVTMRHAADLLSSDARPAPMAEEVKALLAEAASDKWIFTGSLALDNLVARLAACVERQAVNIDDLTRKVAEAAGLLRQIRHDADLASETGIHDPDPDAEAEIVLVIDAFLAGQPISRPQDTGAVLAEREACAKIAEHLFPKDGVSRADWAAGSEIARAIRSRLSPGPATETERKDGWWRVAMTETVQAAKGLLSKNEAKHFGEMLAEATADFFDHDKAVTWLGWMQGFLEARHLVPRDALRRINTEAKASVRPKQEGI